MATCFIDPLTDKRYQKFIENHPDAGLFHSSLWINVLHQTYNFIPGCVATIVDNEIRGVIPYMETRSITGKPRCISLPFSDMCSPLFSDNTDFNDCLDALVEYGKKYKWRYIELRGGARFFRGQNVYTKIYTHTIDLNLGEDELFASLRPSMRRNIRKAYISDLTSSSETSIETLKEFYRLNCLTRRDHGLPPQPWDFFLNLFDDLLDGTNGFIVTVKVGLTTIASSVYFILNRRAVYKYGASDRAFLSVRPNDFMMWKSILLCKERGCTTLNLGRTEEHHKGLLHFKRGITSNEYIESYFRCIPSSGMFIQGSDNNEFQIYSRIMSNKPIWFLRSIGELLYRYVG